MDALWKHLLIELYECNPNVLHDVVFVEESLRDAAIRAGATIVKSAFHNFSSQGVSGVLVIAESHITIHTWPQFSYAALDIFTCSERLDPYLIRDLLIESFAASRFNCRIVERGPDTVLPDILQRQKNFR